MSPEFVLVDGDEIHLESGLAWTSLCGETFNSDDVDRDRFRLDVHSSDRRCRRCNLVALDHADDRRAVK